MSILLTNQRVLRWLFVYSVVDETITKRVKFVHGITTFGILVAHFCAVSAGISFFIKFVTIDLERSLFSLFNILGDISVTYISIFLLLKRRKIVVVFKKMSDIYEASKKVLNT